MWELSSYIGLFLIALGAATVLPLQSEFALVAMLLSGHYDPLPVLLVATPFLMAVRLFNNYPTNPDRSIGRFTRQRRE